MTRRVVPDDLFRKTTRIMIKMRDIFQKVKISPVNGNHEFTMHTYYSELSAHDRTIFDS